MTNRSISVAICRARLRKLGPASVHSCGQLFTSRSHGRRDVSTIKSQPKTSKHPAGCGQISFWQDNTAVRICSIIHGHVYVFHISRAEQCEVKSPLCSSNDELRDASLVESAHSKN